MYTIGFIQNTFPTRWMSAALAVVVGATGLQAAKPVENEIPAEPQQVVVESAPQAENLELAMQDPGVVPIPPFGLSQQPEGAARELYAIADVSERRRGERLSTMQPVTRSELLASNGELFALNEEVPLGQEGQIMTVEDGKLTWKNARDFLSLYISRGGSRSTGGGRPYYPPQNTPQRSGGGSPVILYADGASVGGAISYVSGTLGVGTSNPEATLDVQGMISGNSLRIHGTRPSFFLGSVGIGTKTPETKLEVIGTGSGRQWFAMDHLASSGTLTVDGDTRLREDLYLGDDLSTDITYVKTKFSGSLIPLTTNLYDLGSDTLRWRDLYLSGSSLHIGESGDEGIIGYNENADYFFFDPNGTKTPTVVITDSGNLGIGTDVPIHALDAIGTVHASLTLASSGTLVAEGITTLNGNTFIGNEPTDTISASGRFITDLVPLIDSSVSLGSDANRWADAYFDRGFATLSLSSSGTLTVESLTNLNGDTDIGDTFSDTVTFNASVDSHIIPETDDLYDLGSNLLRWRNVYTHGVTIGFETGSVVFTGTGGELKEDNANFFWDQFNNRLGIGTTAPLHAVDVAGTIHASDTLASSGTLVAAGVTTLNGNTFIGDSATDTITASGRFVSDLTPLVDDAVALGSDTNRWRDLFVGPSSLDIGTSGNSAKIHYRTATELLGFDPDNNGTDNVVMLDNGNVGIGVAAPVHALQVSGTVQASDTLASSGTLSVDGASTLDGTLTVAGLTTLNDSVDLGDAITDTVTFLAYVDSHIIPSVDNMYDIGASANRWRNVFTNGLNLGFQTGSVVFTGTGGELKEDNANFHWDQFNNRLGIGTTAPLHAVDVAGTIHASDTLASSGTLVSAGVTTLNGNTFIGNAATDTITASGRFVSDLTPLVDDAVALGSDTNRWRDLFLGPTSLDIGTSGTNSKITRGATGLGFDTDANGTSEIVFLSNGNIGVGVTTPTHALQVSGTIQATTLASSGALSVDGAATFDGAVTLSTITQGSLLFAGAGGVVSQDNANFFWDDTNNRLGIGTVTPGAALDVLGTISGTTVIAANGIESDGTLIVDGLTTLNGSIDLGDAITDTITAVGQFDSSLIPDGTTRNLGSDANRWGDLFISGSSIHMGTSGDEVTMSFSTLTDTLTIDQDTNVTGTLTASSTLASSGTLSVDGAASFDSTVTLSSITQGSMLFAGVGGVVSQDNTNLFWDDTNNRLGIGTSSPGEALEVVGSISGSSITAAQTLISNGSLTVEGLSTLNGSVALGDTSSDVITFNGQIGSNLTPTTTNAYSIGSDTLRWNDLFLSGASMHMGQSGDEGIMGFNDGFFLDSNGNGNPDFVFTDAGRFGVGTTTPSTSLEVMGTISGSSVVASTATFDTITLNGALDLGLTQGSVTFINASGEVTQDNANFFWDDTNNRLSIGSITPSHELDVTGTIHASQTLSSSGTLSVDGDAVFDGNLTFGSASSDTVTFNAEIASDLLPSADVTYSLGSSAKRWKELYLSGSSLHIGANGDEGTIGYNETADYFYFDPNGNGTPSFVMTDTGNMGIGTDSPSQLLHVRKDQNSNTMMLLENLSTGAAAQTNIRAANDAGSVAQLGIYGSGNSGYGALTADAAYLYTGGLGTSDRLVLMADKSSGHIVFATGGNSEKMRIDNFGNVGIGNSTPQTKLDVAGGISGTTLEILGDVTFDTTTFVVDSTNDRVGIGEGTPAAKFEVATADSDNLEAFLIDTEETTGTQDVFKIISDVAGDEDAAFRIQANGEVFSDSAYNSTGADYAEYFFTADTDLKHGEVVCVDPSRENAVRRCTNVRDGNVIGVVSHRKQAAFVGNMISGADGIVPPNYVLVGLIGQVAAFITDENGEVRPGDALTPASTPGQAMRAEAGDPTVGVALEGGNGFKKVLIARRNSSLTVETVEQHVLETVEAMEIEDEVQILISSAMEEIGISDTISDEVFSQITDLDLFNEVNTLVEDKLEGLISFEGDEAVLQISNSAMVGDALDVQGPASFSDTLSVVNSITAESITINDSAILAGDVQIDGSLIVGGSLTVAQDATIEGTLTTENVQIRGDVNIDGTLSINGEPFEPGAFATGEAEKLELTELLVKDSIVAMGDVTFEGIAQFAKTVVFKDEVVFTDRYGGKAIIPEGRTDSEYISFDPPFSKAPIVTATPTDDGEFVEGPYRLRKVSTDGFYIQLKHKQPTTVVFDWQAMSVDGEWNMPKIERNDDGDVVVVEEEDGSTLLAFYTNEEGQPLTENDELDTCIWSGNAFGCERDSAGANQWTPVEGYLAGVTFTYNPGHNYLKIPDTHRVIVKTAEEIAEEADDSDDDSDDDTGDDSNDDSSDDDTGDDSDDDSSDDDTGDDSDDDSSDDDTGDDSDDDSSDDDTGDDSDDDSSDDDTGDDSDDDSSDDDTGDDSNDDSSDDDTGDDSSGDDTGDDSGDDSGDDAGDDTGDDDSGDDTGDDDTGDDTGDDSGDDTGDDDSGDDTGDDAGDDSGDDTGDDTGDDDSGDDTGDDDTGDDSGDDTGDDTGDDDSGDDTGDDSVGDQDAEEKEPVEDIAPEPEPEPEPESDTEEETETPSETTE